MVYCLRYQSYNKIIHFLLVTNKKSLTHISFLYLVEIIVWSLHIQVLCELSSDEMPLAASVDAGFVAGYIFQTGGAHVESSEIDITFNMKMCVCISCNDSSAAFISMLNTSGRKIIRIIRYKSYLWTRMWCIDKTAKRSSGKHPYI